MLVAVTILTVFATTTITAFATSQWIDSDEIEDTIKAKNDDGRQAIADADCNPGDTSGVVLGDLIQTQDCDALAANRDNLQQETTGGEEEPPAPETCEECFRAFLTPEQIDEVNPLLSLERFCNFLMDPPVSLQLTEAQFRVELENADVGDEEIDSLVECLLTVGIEFRSE
jgi:hypothetical protein